MASKERTLGIILGVAVVVLAGAGFYAWRQGLFTTSAKAPPAPAPAARPTPPTAPEIQHPVPAGAEAQAQPLPALGDSDGVVRDGLKELFGPEVVERSFARQNLVRRIVATIDNLPRQKLAVELRPVNPPPGNFLVSGSEGAWELDPHNFDRYRAVVNAIGALDVHRLAAVYYRLYPLFQSAYESLGYPSAYFNDRLIAVIDDLLATPEVTGPIQLVQPRVYYEYQDPTLEGRSAGQKLIIRMGPENAAIIKRKLRELRSELTKGAPAR
jgi:hypothetical protein